MDFQVPTTGCWTQACAYTAFHASRFRLVILGIETRRLMEPVSVLRGQHPSWSWVCPAASWLHPPLVCPLQSSSARKPTTHNQQSTTGTTTQPQTHNHKHTTAAQNHNTQPHNHNHKNTTTTIYSYIFTLVCVAFYVAGGHRVAFRDANWRPWRYPDANSLTLR